MKVTSGVKPHLGLRKFAVIGAMLLFLLQGSIATGESQGSVSDLRAIQRQYQQFSETQQLLTAEISQRQYELGKEGLEQCEDILEALTDIGKQTPPGDPEGQLEFSKKLVDLAQWAYKTTDDIFNSEVEIAEGEARLGQLKQNLVQAIRNQNLTLQPLPEPQQPDQSALDEAIENLRKEDQALLEAENQQLGVAANNSNGDPGIFGAAPAHPDIIDPSADLPQLRQTLQDLQQQLNSSSQDLQQAQNQLQFQQQQVQAAQNNAQGTGLQIAIPIPDGWVPCTCPDQHPGAGIFVNGVQYHTPLLQCQ